MSSSPQTSGPPSAHPPSTLEADRQGARVRVTMWALLAMALVVVAIVVLAT